MVGIAIWSVTLPTSNSHLCQPSPCASEIYSKAEMNNDLSFTIDVSCSYSCGPTTTYYW